MRLTSRESPRRDRDPDLAFFARVMRALHRAGVPSLVGGAACLQHHTGISRDTKDLDLFIHPRDVERAISVLNRRGMKTERTFPHWLAKAREGARFVDLIHDSGNGATPVDDLWFAHASYGTLLGEPAAFCPAEETIWSKAFVMERERFDGADIAHLLASRGPKLDWERLLWRFGDHWRVLFAHLVLFQFVYPDLSRATIPGWVIAELATRLLLDPPPRLERVCMGTLLSREQYLPDLEWGWRDGRLEPVGAMTAEQIALWTAAITSGR